MRLLSRSNAGGVVGGLRDRPAHTRQSPASVLTSWLRQGLRSGMCPLCRVAHKADREYIWHFFDEGADSDEQIDQVRAAYGFCAEHVEMLRRLEMEGLKSTLALSTMFADALQGIVADLDQLTADRPFEPAKCPACANRDDQLEVNAGYLLRELATSPGHRSKFESSPGLCFPHFRLVWGVAQSRSEREFLLGVQRQATRNLLHDVSEHVRKHDDRYRHEPKGSESDSWQRAIFLTTGWPPPAATAGQPEEDGGARAGRADRA
jgi:hypothetical protein